MDLTSILLQVAETEDLIGKTYDFFGAWAFGLVVLIAVIVFQYRQGKSDRARADERAKEQKESSDRREKELLVSLKDRESKYDELSSDMTTIMVKVEERLDVMKETRDDVKEVKIMVKSILNNGGNNG